MERLVLAMTHEQDWVLDPFLGVGSSVVAALLHHRRGMGAEIEEKYVRLARERILQTMTGTLKTRPMYQPIYDPKDKRKQNKAETCLSWDREKAHSQLTLW